MEIHAKRTYLPLTCEGTTCVGTIKLFMKKLVTIHKLIHTKKGVIKKTLRKKELLLVGVGRFEIPKSRTDSVKISITTRVAKLILKQKRLSVFGEILIEKQRPVAEKFTIEAKRIKENKKVKSNHRKKKKK